MVVQNLYEWPTNVGFNLMPTPGEKANAQHFLDNQELEIR